MRWGDLFATSLASLRQRKFRTFLTVLGVLIGVMAVVVMVSIGVGLSSSLTESMSSNLGMRQVTVYTGPDPALSTSGVPSGQTAALDDNLVASLAAEPGAETVIPVYSANIEMRVGTTTSWSQVTGMSRAGLEALGVDYVWGGVPEEGAPLSFLVGDRFGEMFYDAQGVPLDIDWQQQTMFITFDPQGMYGEPVVPNPEGPEPTTPSKRLIVPVSGVISPGDQEWGIHSTSAYAELDALTDAMVKAMAGKALPGQPAKADGSPRSGPFVYSEIRLLAPDATTAEAVYNSLKNQGYGVSSEIEWIKEMKQQGLIIQAAFGGIGLISLLVAAIGIANTMMMSVYERTKEIGVMKVLGASLRDIRTMFLVESATIGLLGGLLGLLFSFLLSLAINGIVASQYQGSATVSVIPIWLAVGSVAFAVAIGALAGLAPARRAMRLSPLAAIRAQ